MMRSRIGKMQAVMMISQESRENKEADEDG
jgi:hypothetical protein